MPRFIYKVKPLKEARDLRRRIEQTTKGIVRAGAHEFVKEVVHSVPVLTGEARGSLLPISRALAVRVPRIVGRPTRNKSRQTGRRPDKKALWKFGRNGDVYFFNFDIQLFHHWWNDLFPHNYPNGQRPTPWMGVAKGAKAFEKEVDMGLAKMADTVAFFLERTL